MAASTIRHEGENSSAVADRKRQVVGVVEGSDQGVEGEGQLPLRREGEGAWIIQRDAACSNDPRWEEAGGDEGDLSPHGTAVPSVR